MKENEIFLEEAYKLEESKDFGMKEKRTGQNLLRSVKSESLK